MIESRIKAPGKTLFWTEGGRALLDFGRLPVMAPLLRAAPRGEGAPVMVVPGLAGGDGSTLTLRLFLRRKGHAAVGWQQGRNLGAHAVLEPLRAHLEALYERYRQPVGLVGWSLGGIYARELAKAAPDRVRCVITLASPFKGPETASNVQWVYQWLSGHRGSTRRAGDALAQTPAVPTTAIYTRGDGIVAWQRCVEAPRAQVESIEVPGSHCGLGHNAFALYAVADRLAQPPNDWRAFSPPRGQRRFYRDPWRDSPG